MKDIIAEVLCVLHWSSDAQKAFNDALKDYRRAGSPPIPLGSVNYRATYKAKIKAHNDSRHRTQRARH